MAMNLNGLTLLNLKGGDYMLFRKRKTQHRLQPVSGTKDDLLRIVSKVYFKSKITWWQRLRGWL